MTRVRATLGQIARRSRAAVLVLGESGTGRRHCARALHAATYPEGELLELAAVDQLGELERSIAALRARAGAPSVAGLTVYVPELCEAAAAVQLQLSRLLRERGLPLRIIASSGRVLAQACRDGSLRSDLVFGFPNVVDLPPLRERAADIPVLSQRFGQLSATRNGLRPVVLSRAALQRLKEHAWPGNLTELENLMERLSQRVHDRVVGQEDLPELGDRASGVCFILPPNGIDFAELERAVLTQALTMSHNNQTRAAALLGLTRDQLRYRLGKFEIRSSVGRAAE
jgi:DNA-binding NtrC family response regulator